MTVRDISGIVVVDKPLGKTSQAVTLEVRRLFGARKAGHAGTLDPLATGVLPICLNDATKVVQFLLSDDKSYRATLLLGEETDSGDREGKVVATSDWTPITKELLLEALGKFQGEIELEVPIYSAIKREGKSLYHYARKGLSIESLPKKKTRIYRIDIIEFSPPKICLEISCSKGTYVRSLCRDLGRALGTHATLIGLDRLRCGVFFKKEALSLDALREVISQSDPQTLLIPPLSALRHYPFLTLTSPQVQRVRQGIRLSAALFGDLNGSQQKPICLIEEGTQELVAVAQVAGDHLRTLRVFEDVRATSKSP